MKKFYLQKLAHKDFICYKAGVAAGTITALESPPSPRVTRPTDLRQLENDVVSFTEKIFESCTTDRDREREIRELVRIMDFIDGRHYASGQRYGRNRAVVPKVRRNFIEQIGLLTDLALTFTVKMFGDRLNEFSDLEKILKELSVHWSQSNEVCLEQSLYDLVVYGLLREGVGKIFWNSTLNGMGDVQMIPIAPWQWGCIGAGTKHQDAEVFLFFPVVTREHLARRFGKALASRVECDMEFGGQLSGGFNRPSHISKAAWATMGQGLQKALGVKKSTVGNDALYPMVIQKEYWMKDDSKNESSETVTVGPCDSNGEPRVNWAYRVEPGEMLYPRGRVIVTAGGVVLEDSPNPYWHSKYPFTIFRPFRLPWKLTGDPAARSWMQMNGVINQLMSGMLDYLRSVNEPTLVAPKGAFPAPDWDALDPGAPGGKLKYNNNAPSKPDFMKRADAPIAANMEYLRYMDREFDMSSGASAMQQALGKKQVPGGDSLEMILSSRSLPVKVESRSLAWAIEDGGALAIADMLQFYSVSHRLAILGEKGISAADFRPIYGHTLPQGMKGEDFVRKFQGVIRRDTMLESQKDQKKQYAIALAKMGKLSDRNLFRILDENFDFTGNQKELLEEARVKMLVQAAAAALQGKGKGQQKK